MNKFLAVFVAVAVFVPSVASASIGLTLFGANPATINAGSSYSEAGYKAVSTVDGDITGNVSTTDSGDFSVVGTHTRTYSVTDSTPETVSSVRTIVTAGGDGTMLFCSGPLAPGWRTDLVGGGCGGAAVVLIPRGESRVVNGVLESCPAWFPGGCVAKLN